MLNRMLKEARSLERRALELESAEGICADPLGAAALYRIAALIYHYAGSESDLHYANDAGRKAQRAAEAKAEQAERREVERRALEPQRMKRKPLFSMSQCTSSRS